ncbi:phage late control D family protein [Paenibacillus camelliae]|uniref:phage late control D family protein n=1 Tax=Paenibacillus camelliae TaxID=512410 RepID=UPI0020410A41|nr:contractile injection system protein, VgrG/Pvc8 family [Paenibacillus camelliae]MCM3632929.1 contractile injection system protein, VgrG/Pvc8 family [Paenibacillus camelliae]
MNNRRAEVQIKYNNVDITKSLQDDLMSFSYNDNGTGKADDVSIMLDDKDGNWSGAWMPEDGAKLDIDIVLYNWLKESTARRIKCGTFYVDGLNYDGPPDVITFKALSYDLAGGLKNEEKSKAWEKISLSQIAKRIATANGLKLIFEIDDIRYDRIDQTQQSDVAFLAQLVEKEGGNLKITSDTIVVYDDRRFESIKPVRKIERGVSDVKSYGFTHNTLDAAYAKCTVTYYDSSAKKTYTGTFSAPGNKKGPTLKLQQRVESNAEAQRLAKNELRKRNKEASKAQFVLFGDPDIVQGVTIEVIGYRKFDGTYFVESVTQNVAGSGGFTTTVNMRKVLNY